jgi:hypothetical protein
MTRPDRKQAHAMLDKIFDGGHEGNIEATLATMKVYAEALSERKELEELHREATELDARIRDTEKAVIKDTGMKWYRMVKKIDGLDRYEVGSKIPLYRGNRGQLLYHLWKTIIEVDETCVVEDQGKPIPQSYPDVPVSCGV